MSAIAKTVWMIETHLGTPLSLDDMAAHAGLSRSHLSRIFPLSTGYSISAYVRGRRLSEAAKALAGGAPDILGVALDAGYGSHEAFTRAFRDQFDLTPDELRSRRSLNHLELLEPIPMTDVVAVHLPEPRIEDRPAMRIAGLTERHLMARPVSLPAQWQKFQTFIGHVPGAVPGVAYGVVGQMRDDCDDFEYMCGMEVAERAELPPEFKLIRIPAQRFARFTHSGHISTIRSTIGAIGEQWLPTSGYEHGDDLSFIEYYRPDFDPATGLGTVEIWFGIKSP